MVWSARKVFEVNSFLNDLPFEDLSIMPKVPKAKRHRITTLKEKRAVVDRYVIFCTTAQPVDENAILLYDPDDELEDERSEKSIKMFLLTENKLWPPNEQLDMSNVFKWIKAYDRGEYFEWGSINDILTSRTVAQKRLSNISMGYSVPNIQLRRIGTDL